MMTKAVMQSMVCLLPVWLAVTGGAVFGEPVPANLAVKSTYASPETCDCLTDGCFIVWWDKTYDYHTQAKDLADTLLDVRHDCLTEFHMSDPPSVLAGYYYNVYIHNGKDCFKKNHWAAGQGTDENHFPFETIPLGYANPGNDLVHHEGFHIFQYLTTSPGYHYNGDSQWFTEASANWYATSKHPEHPRNYVSGSAVTAQPQVPMWYSLGNMEAGEPRCWQRGCHQYGMNLFLSYLTANCGVPKEYVAGGFYAGTELAPQEYLDQRLGGNRMADLYADWAAHAAGGYDYLVPGAVHEMESDLAHYGKPGETHKYIRTFDNTGTEGEWYRPEPKWVTRNWGFNVYKITNSSAGTYTFHFNGDKTGNNGIKSFFEGRVVVRNTATDVRQYYPMVITEDQTGTITVPVQPADGEVYFVVAATPKSFHGNGQFSYEIKIDKAG